MRTLLGRHYFCSEFGNLTARHLQHAKGALSQYDAVLVLGEEALDDAVRAQRARLLPRAPSRPAPAPRMLPCQRPGSE